MISSTLKTKVKKSCFPRQKNNANETLPVQSILLKIRTISKDENISTTDVCHVICKNPTLKKEIITVANSLRNTPDRVTDIEFAVLFIGMEKLDSVIESRVKPQ